MIRGSILIVAGLLAVAAGRVQAQAPSSAPSTRAGVYTEAQATRGRDTFAGFCQACHSTATHSGTVFTATWAGRPLWDLVKYVSESMPKNEPGSLSLAEYAQVTAYILKINDQPAGAKELPTDSVALKKIQFETRK